MLIVKNKLLPFGDFTCMNVLGILFVKKDANITPKILNHESIHSAQQYEIMFIALLMSLILSNIYASWWYLLISIVLPVVLYIILWLIELILPPYNSAYKDSPFEREAYFNQNKDNYLVTRPLFAWVKYILKQRKKGETLL